MAKETDIRIMERNLQAEFHRSKQGPVAHTIGKAGLATANAMDRVTQPLRSDRLRFIGASLYGAMRGATVGGVIGIVGVLIATGAAVAVTATPFFWGAMAVGAAVHAVRDGQKALDTNWNRHNHQLADTIAEKTGAIPTPHVMSVSERKKVEKEAQKIIAESAPPKEGFFAKRETQRKSATQPVFTDPTVLR